MADRSGLDVTNEMGVETTKMELLALANALIIVGSFVAGFYLAKKQFTDVVTRLTRQNNELLGSIYARIGYVPPKPTEVVSPSLMMPVPVVASETTSTANDDQPQPKPPNGFPDLFARRNEAFERERRMNVMQGIDNG